MSSRPPPALQAMLGLLIIGTLATVVGAIQCPGPALSSLGNLVTLAAFSKIPTASWAQDTDAPPACIADQNLDLLCTDPDAVDVSACSASDLQAMDAIMASSCGGGGGGGGVEPPPGGLPASVPTTDPPCAVLSLVANFADLGVSGVGDCDSGAGVLEHGSSCSAECSSGLIAISCDAGTLTPHSSCLSVQGFDASSCAVGTQVQALPTGTIACDFCRPGRFDADGNPDTFCEPCPVDTYAPLAGMAYCESCWEGTGTVDPWNNYVAMDPPYQTMPYMSWMFTAPHLCTDSVGETYLDSQGYSCNDMDAFDEFCETPLSWHMPASMFDFDTSGVYGKDLCPFHCGRCAPGGGDSWTISTNALTGAATCRTQEVRVFIALPGLAVSSSILFYTINRRNKNAKEHNFLPGVGF